MLAPYSTLSNPTEFYNSVASSLLETKSFNYSYFNNIAKDSLIESPHR